jgi:hypothetical protein
MVIRLIFQVNALLNEVTLKDHQREEIERFIQTISNELKSIPQGKIREVKLPIYSVYSICQLFF